MKTQTEIEQMLMQIEADERLSYPPANIETNSILAMIQLGGKMQSDVLREVLGMPRKEWPKPAPGTTLFSCDAKPEDKPVKIGSRVSWKATYNGERKTYRGLVVDLCTVRTGGALGKPTSCAKILVEADCGYPHIRFRKHTTLSLYKLKVLTEVAA